MGSILRLNAPRAVLGENASVKSQMLYVVDVFSVNLCMPNYTLQ